MHRVASSQTGYDRNYLQVLMQQVEVAIGHRWSAAFPHVNGDYIEDLDSEAYQRHGQSRAFVSPDARFAACGDYFLGGQEKHLLGKIEGAVLSGTAAAEGIIKSVTQT